jgi:hypothetical protein
METIEAEYTVAGEVEPTVALTPVPQQNPVLVNLKVEGERFVGYANAATVTDPESAKRASNDITLIRGFLKDAESWRKKYKAPLLEAGRDLDRYFTDLTDPFNKANETYEAKVLAYNKEEERKRQEIKRLNDLAEEKARIEREMAERKAREEREKWEREQREAAIIAAALNEPPPAPVPPPPAPVFVEPPKPVEVPDQQKRVRSDVGTLTFVPKADTEKLQAAVGALPQPKPPIEIPGVTIYCEWKFKVLKVDMLPEEYRKVGTRVNGVRG